MGRNEGANAHSASEDPQPPLSAYRLPRGRHGIPPEQVEESQRWRLLGAAAEVVAERGYGRTKASDIASRAGVSRATFYEQFENLSGCLLAAYEMTADCVSDLALAGPGALEDVLQFLAEEPALAHLLGPETAAGVPAIAAARQRFVSRLVGVGIERHSLEGALALVSKRVAAGEAADLPEIASQLTGLIRCEAGKAAQTLCGD